MKNSISLSLFLIVFVTLFSACNKDAAPPSITDFELGYNNSKIFERGSDLHFEANIVAPAKIDRIIVEIHFEGDHKKSGLKTEVGFEWEFDYTYTSYNGLKNVNLHKHIEIPEDAKAGDYHFHLMVIDMDGNVAEVESDFEIHGEAH